MPGVKGARGIMRKSRLRIAREVQVVERLRKIISDEKFVAARVAEETGWKPNQFAAWLCNSVAASPVQIERAEQWLAKWDAAEIDVEKLKQSKRNIPMSEPSVFIRLIRARMAGKSIRALSKAANIPYSRAHGMINGSESNRYFNNLEAALAVVSPGLMEFVQREIERAEKAAAKAAEKAAKVPK